MQMDHFRAAHQAIDRAYSVWVEYERNSRATSTLKDKMRMHEIERRIWQLRWILCEVNERDARCSSSFSLFTKSGVKNTNENDLYEKYLAEVKMLIFFVESFYVFAFRVQKVVEKLPGLKSFHVRSITMIRNDFLLHPTRRNDEILTEAFSFGGPSGPTLRGGRTKGVDDHVPYDTPDRNDAGIYINCLEFSEKLVSLLTQPIVRQDT